MGYTMRTLLHSAYLLTKMDVLNTQILLIIFVFYASQDIILQSLVVANKSLHQ